MKTARFVQVIAACGKPESYTLWTAPEADPAFKKAVEQQRVMTVHQANVGARKDYGTAGFDPKAQGSFLIFPKSLRRFAGVRVIGINYDLLMPEKKGKPSTTNNEADEGGAAESKYRAAVRAAMDAPIRPGSRKPPAPAASSSPNQIRDNSKSASGPTAGKSRKAPAKRHPPLRIVPFPKQESAPASQNREFHNRKAKTPPMKKKSKSPAKKPDREAIGEPSASAVSAHLKALMREVRKALRQLEAGKAVAAFQTLEAALAAAES